MNVLLVYAHPEPTSLNGSLRDFSVQRLQAAGHTVQVSDLYAMNWKATLDADDAPQRDATKPFHASLDSKVAYAEGTQAADIARERSLTIDEVGFEREMEAQRERARSASAFGLDYNTLVKVDVATEFTGYTATTGEAAFAPYAGGAVMNTAIALYNLGALDDEGLLTRLGRKIRSLVSGG